ncbi:MAG TPA: tRNA (5-methylaminomethyl-2-thiouridine)(34)-methyltransferase MnmD [Bacteroidia bacterium]|nr:tRNA (5-methylaminomethyl-2-thiouridine)(34)-methyltransferase MnmD [Bacteroidia bacterium]
MNDKFYNREIVLTSDGSSSIYLPEFNEHYHSTHGAVQESRHVFMKRGWEEVIRGKSSIEILEVGFGTGLNAWLVYEETLSGNSPEVYYSAIEAFPVTTEMASLLNYCSPEQKAEFMKLHEADWNAGITISLQFILEKIQTTLADFVPFRKYDLVFFDAFAPRVQPEMWTKEVFDKMFAAMSPGGILVTYCSKGEVRRNMIAAGFTVEKVPGPPGKREMLRAVKSDE